MALCDITTDILRTINATENAMSELTPPNPNDRPYLEGAVLKPADAAYRELEENVSLQMFFLHATMSSLMLDLMSHS